MRWAFSVLSLVSCILLPVFPFAFLRAPNNLIIYSTSQKIPEVLRTSKQLFQTSFVLELAEGSLYNVLYEKKRKLSIEQKKKIL